MWSSACAMSGMLIRAIFTRQWHGVFFYSGKYKRRLFFPVPMSRIDYTCVADGKMISYLFARLKNPSAHHFSLTCIFFLCCRIKSFNSIVIGDKKWRCNLLKQILLTQTTQEALQASSPFKKNNQAPPDLDVISKIPSERGLYGWLTLLLLHSFLLAILSTRTYTFSQESFQTPGKGKAFLSQDEVV